MSSSAAALRSLSDEDTIHRVLLNSKQAADPHEAFMLRPDEKDDGLSVNFDCTPNEARTQECFEKTYGVASLLVGGVRQLKLEVVPDQPRHANITGVPYKGDNPAQAEWIASQLADRVTNLSRERWKRPK
jgi:hypothetical protein